MWGVTCRDHMIVRLYDYNITLKIKCNEIGVYKKEIGVDI